MIDASDERLLAWLAELPPRQELVLRMALNGVSKNQGPDWDRASSADTRVQDRHHREGGETGDRSAQAGQGDRGVDRGDE